MRVSMVLPGGQRTTLGVVSFHYVDLRAGTQAILSGSKHLAGRGISSPLGYLFAH